MRAVYNTPEDIILEDVAPENITPKNIALEDIIAPEDIMEEITPAATQDNYNQASYEFHAMQVKYVHEKVAQNNETYRNKLVIRGSVHRRKVVFEPGDKVAMHPTLIITKRRESESWIRLVVLLGRSSVCIVITELLELRWM
ncbi:11428_t:CDS:1, partial [Gigaspora margarita]